jgi:hypothetical protein
MSEGRYHLTQDDLLRRLFRRADSSGDGYVSKKELQIALRKYITLREQLGIALNLNQVDSNEVYRRVAAIRDPQRAKDLSAGISFEELSCYIKDEAMPQALPPPSESTEGLSSEGRNLFFRSFATKTTGTTPPSKQPLQKRPSALGRARQSLGFKI